MLKPDCQNCKWMSHKWCYHPNGIRTANFRRGHRTILKIQGEPYHPCPITLPPPAPPENLPDCQNCEHKKGAECNHPAPCPKCARRDGQRAILKIQGSPYYPCPKLRDN